MAHLPGEHDEEEDPEAPDVAGGVVALPLEHLGRDKVGGVAGRHEEAVLGAELLGEAEVADAEGVGIAAVVGVEDVGRLQVTMDYLQGVTFDRVEIFPDLWW